MRRLGAAAATAVLGVIATAYAVPQRGERFTRIEADDVTGQRHATDELVGRPTLVVAIIDRGAADAMRAWYAVADAKIPASVARESILSLHLPFFVSTSYARSKARESVPERYWHQTLLDRGKMREELGLRGDRPYVFALDKAGRVMAVVQGEVTSPEAQIIWDSFRTK
jgi:predicted transcriptional regulator